MNNLVVWALSIAQAFGGGVQAENASTVTQCQEADNLSVVISPKSGEAIRKATLTATPPLYPIGEDNGDPNFENCDPDPGPTYQYTPKVVKIHDDGNLVITCVTDSTFWRSQAMRVRVGSTTVTDVHYVRVNLKISGVNSWPEVAVFYSDGGVRTKPHLQVGYADNYFGTTVLMGPFNKADERPVADIGTLVINPATQQFYSNYRSGGSTALRIVNVDRTEFRANLAFNFDVTSSQAPLALRSMYVDKPRSDANRIVWIDEQGQIHREEVFDVVSPFFATRVGTVRFERSTHNTSAPNHYLSNFYTEPKAQLFPVTAASLLYDALNGELGTPTNATDE